MVNLRICLLLLFCWGVAWGLNDPTRPPNALEGAPRLDTENSLAFLLTSEFRQIALVKGNYLSVGDTVEGQEVVSISEEGVELLNLKTGALTLIPVISTTIRQPVEQASTQGLAQ